VCESGKSLDELSIGEAAYLAALPKAPSNYHPTRQPTEAKIRRDYVIGRMLEDGYITPEQAAAARAEVLQVRRRPDSETVTADFFAEAVETTCAFGSWIGDDVRSSPAMNAAAGSAKPSRSRFRFSAIIARR